MTKLVFSLCLLLHNVTAYGQVFRWRDADGVVHYSDRQRASGTSEQVAVNQYVPPLPEPVAARIVPKVQATIPAEPPAPAVTPISVVMYTSPTCGWCRKAERFLLRRGIAWNAIDITASEQANREFAKLGGRGTPLIFIEGQRIAGFNQERLDRILRAYGR